MPGNTKVKVPTDHLTQSHTRQVSLGRRPTCGTSMVHLLSLSLIAPAFVTRPGNDTQRKIRRKTSGRASDSLSMVVPATPFRERSPSSIRGAGCRAQDDINQRLMGDRCSPPIDWGSESTSSHSGLTVSDHVDYFLLNVFHLLFLPVSYTTPYHGSNPARSK